MKYSQYCQWKQVSCLQNIATCFKHLYLYHMKIVLSNMKNIAEKG